MQACRVRARVFSVPIPWESMVSELGGAGAIREVEAAIHGAPDPRDAKARAADVLAAAAATVPEAVRAAFERHCEGMARVLATTCGTAPFLAAHLRRRPEWLTSLAAEDFRRARTKEQYRRLLHRAVSTAGAEPTEAVLRQFKYYELARITVRECSPDIVPLSRVPETLLELSDLADVLLEQALEEARRRVAERLGEPVWHLASGARFRPRFVILGLGKLGARELNYSSDVDLLYVFEAPPEEDPVAAHRTGTELAPAEYFTSVAQEFGRLVTQPTANGFLYRIDLDLRPEGTRGPLVSSTAALQDYYELWAAQWERTAFTKARPVAGDLDLGEQLIASLHPVLYRSSMDYQGVEALRELKRRVEEEKGRRLETFDVKIGRGGIRDLELVVQALQLLHGGRLPELRTRSTHEALGILAEVGILPAEDAGALREAYCFLRRLENRLQMIGERQTHRLPADPGALERLARSLGFRGTGARADFVREVERHRQAVGRVFEKLLPRTAHERILGLFRTGAPRLFEHPLSAAMMDELAERFARNIESGPNPERALANLQRFVEGVGRRTFYYELLIDRPELVPRLAALFAASEYLSVYLANHPRLIEPIFSDPNVLLLSRRQLRSDLAALRRELTGDGARDRVEAELEALRMFHHRAVINVGLLDLAGKVDFAEAQRALTDIAEVCVGEALRIARGQIRRRRYAAAGRISRAPFLAVGMGKLGSGELSYGSDLDLIFLYDPAEADPAEAQEYFVRLAQKLIWALQTRTRAGICYAIDARLRPSGNQGMLVSSMESFRTYHQRSAQTWERQALLRARPVAGDRKLARSFEVLRREILSRPLPPDAAAEIHRIRLRMERELARETKAHHDFKTGRGGMIDVETVVQYLQLRHGSEHPELLAVMPVAEAIDQLARHGALEEQDAAVLREGWRFLQRLASRLRIVENRSISDLDEERGDLESVALALGYPATERHGGARRALLEDYARHTAAVREIYLRVLGVPAPASAARELDRQPVG